MAHRRAWMIVAGFLAASGPMYSGILANVQTLLAEGWEWTEPIRFRRKHRPASTHGPRREIVNPTAFVVR